MGKVMVIDLAICNGCHNCQVACKDEHVTNDWSPIARPQPDTGQFWNKVINLERGTVPKVQVTYHHSICQHCGEAPCISATNRALTARMPSAAPASSRPPRSTSATTAPARSPKLVDPTR